ncbi:uncharacterized protein LOC115440463 isoform X2 [Manduca sexta]|uniref:Ciliogenesis-associated TTC17-interacting protein N-terminal domain-containing protein n=1 Tax=Manduca sexta TaxID=7130 RepID=A0A922CFW2_MANSE|nr:uncharacterized protein LOC115440463 isoform X2 [Manduca sexta]KAG6445385.1 hypothetical protein O3G_MSEX003920 [Manduca sexta]
MSFNPNVSLIDLGKQLPFDIDDNIKSEICFGETLVISCGHYEGDIETESTDSDWSCYESTESESSEEVKNDTVFEVKDHVEEEAVAQEEVAEEEHDFHIYFFPDCNKPLPSQDSKASILIEDGMPKVNPAAQDFTFCTCDVDNTGKCSCFVKLPCKCGATVAEECTCAKLHDICICNEGKPQVTCSCKGSDVCVCLPGDKMHATCVCEEVNKPCVCLPGKFPTPICVCKHKPKYEVDIKKTSENGEGGQGNAIETDNSIKVDEPCDCQQIELKPPCLCLKSETCVCETVCVCDIRKPCICEPTESKEKVCLGDDTKSVCSCAEQKMCTCDADTPENCKCFPKVICTCGDPENCKCFAICDCTEPCICDTHIKNVESEECPCLTTPKRLKDGVCTCAVKKEEDRTLKKVRAGEHGYRWCHTVDPKHTYFDYGYGRHDKISYKEPVLEKVKILGLNEEKPDEEVCVVHGIQAPPYKKNIRKPSLDCCSSVGGISICVETLGEDKDRFLVQVVSHSSKEGAKSGSKLVSILDTNLHTMEESRIEHITKKHVTKERRNYIAICESGYYNKVTRICGEQHVVRRLYHTFEAAHNFLLEGANVVLLRYFGIRRYRGNIKTETVLMDGTVCESIYVCLGVSQAIVNGKPLFVVKVERHIIAPSGFIHQTLTVLTLRGTDRPLTSGARRCKACSYTLSIPTKALNLQNIAWIHRESRVG